MSPVNVDCDAGASSRLALVKLKIMNLSNILQQQAVQLLQAEEPWHGPVLKTNTILIGGGGCLILWAWLFTKGKSILFTTNLVEEAMEAEEDEVDEAATEEADEAVDNSEALRGRVFLLLGSGFPDLLAILCNKFCNFFENS